jgi:PhnB protein
MAVKNVNPYLNFNGSAAKAIKFYEKALGAKANNVMRFADVPNMSSPETKDLIMHAVLDLGGGRVMLSDGRPNMTIPPGGNSHVCLDFDDAADMARKFDALAAGGKITMPLQDTFWGAKFGMLTDVFGIRWMFIHETKKS